MKEKSFGNGIQTEQSRAEKCLASFGFQAIKEKKINFLMFQLFFSYFLSFSHQPTGDRKKIKRTLVIYFHQK